MRRSLRSSPAAPLAAPWPLARSMAGSTPASMSSVRTASARRRDRTRLPAASPEASVYPSICTFVPRGSFFISAAACRNMGLLASGIVVLPVSKLMTYLFRMATRSAPLNPGCSPASAASAACSPPASAALAAGGGALVTRHVGAEDGFQRGGDFVAAVWRSDVERGSIEYGAPGRKFEKFKRRLEVRQPVRRGDIRNQPKGRP